MHMRKHSGEKQHKCNFYENFFARNDMRIHIKDDPYKIDKLDKVFAQNDVLAMHSNMINSAKKVQMEKIKKINCYRKY